MDMFNVLITGYVKGEPKIYNGGQVMCASLTVASYKGKNKDGESRGYAYNDIKAFAGVAEYISQHVNDTDYVIVEANIEKEHYTDKTGKEVWAEGIKANSIKAFPTARQNNNQNSYGNAWR